VSVVETPYAFKLLIQEMEAMGIQIRLSDDVIKSDEIDLMFPELYEYEEIEEEEELKPQKRKVNEKVKEALSSSESEDESLSSEASSSSDMEGGNNSANITPEDLIGMNSSEKGLTPMKLLLEQDDGFFDDTSEAEEVIPNIASSATNQSIDGPSLNEEDVSKGSIIGNKLKEDEIEANVASAAALNLSGNVENLSIGDTGDIPVENMPGGGNQIKIIDISGISMGTSKDRDRKLREEDNEQDDEFFAE
jgi:hypothetical protein